MFTGHLAIARNKILKNLLGKATTPNKTNTYNSILSAFDTYIHKMSTALNKPASNFNKWKSSILKEAKKRLDTIQPYRYNKVPQR